MNILQVIDIAAFWFVLIACLSVCIVLLVFRRRSLRLGGRSYENLPGVSVVIAARNEAGTIRHSIESLLRLGDIVKEIIVVNDDSSDQTEHIVEGLAARNNCVTLVTAPELSKGWLGKTSALDYGAKLAGSQYILFTDADVVFTGSVVNDAMSLAQTHHVDHLSTMFSISCQSIAEEICAPIMAMLATTSLSVSSVFGAGAGTGAFNLIKRSTYMSAGGHEPIRGHIVDDVALARMIRACGGDSLFVDLSSGIHVRLFVGLLGYWKAISRSAIPYLRWPIAVTLSLAVFLFLFSVYLLICPTASIVALTLLDPDVKVGWSHMTILPIMTYFIGLLPVLLSLRYTTGRRLFVLLYPCAFAMMMVAVAVAACRFKLNLPLRWRGRSYEPSSFANDETNCMR